MTTLLPTIVTFFFSLLCAHASEIIAVPSSTEITEDENLSIEFRLSSEGATSEIGDPKYDAPDFEEVNVYSRSQSMQSSFINGRITVRRTQDVVSVLHPKKVGRLKISGIQAVIDGKIIRAPDLVIEVHPTGTRLAQKGSGGGAGYAPPGQLPGAGIAQPQRQQSNVFFLRTEPSKLKVYKGEQIILTYALYTRTQIVNIQVERYPTVPGFLKEDMDIPLLRGRLDYSPSVVGGREYRRAVLAQYAVYPVKEGKLTIDAFTGKFSFQAGMRETLDDEDPFGMINQFFRAMQTTTASKSSDRVDIEVLPLPQAGQPKGFSGLVGEFDITAAVDKYSVKAGEPINVKVKVEGKGHAGSLENLGVAWPSEFELYEDKSRTQFLKTGYSERLFEYMLIPKTKGKFEIPAIELSMFNPESQSYQTKKTEPVTIEVLEGSTGNIYVAKPKASEPVKAPAEDLRYWMDSPPPAASSGPFSVAAALASASTLLAFAGLWLTNQSHRKRTQLNDRQKSQQLKAKAQALLGRSQAPGESSDAIFAEVENLLGQTIEHGFGFKTGSMTRSDVGATLLERTRDEALSKRVEALIELCENSRFVPAGTARISAKSACEELLRLVDRISPA